MPDPKPTYLTRREFLKWGTNTSLALFLAACGLLPGDTPLRKDNVSPTGPSAPPPPSTPPPPRQPTPTIEAGSTIPGQKLDIGGGLLELKTYSGVELANRIGAKDKGLKVVTDDKGSITFFTGYAGLNGRQTQEAVLAQAPPGFKWDEKNSLWRKENEIFIPDILLPGDWHPEKNMAGPSHEADVVFLLKDKDNYRIGIIYGKDKMSGIPDKSKLIILPDGSGLYLGGQKNITPGKGEQIIRADDDSLLWINASGDYHRKATSWQHVTSEDLMEQAKNFAGPLALNPDIPYPSDKLMDTKTTGTAIVDYARTYNKNPGEVKKELRPLLRVGKNNVQFATIDTADGTPLFIATLDQKSGEWGWREIKGYKQLTALNGDRVASDAWQYAMRTDAKYRNNFLDNYDVAVTSGIFQMDQLYKNVPKKTLTPEEIITYYDWSKFDYYLNIASSTGTPLKIHYLFGGIYSLNTAPWLTNMSDDQIATWMDLHAGAVADRVNQYNAKQKEGNKVTIEEIDVYNEVFGTDPNFNGEVMSRKLGLEKALEIAFRSARKYFPTSVLMLADNIHYGADTNIAINEESTRTDRVVSSLKARGVPIDGVSEHGHLFIKHFGSQTDVDRYINQLEERAIKLNQAGLVFEIGEADIDIFGASPEQIERAMSLMTTQMKISLKYSKRFILWGTIPKYSWMLDPAYPYGKATPLALHTNDFFPTPLHYEFLKALVPKPQ